MSLRYLNSREMRGYFLFLKVERAQKFRTKKSPDPQLEERAKF